MQYSFSSFKTAVGSLLLAGLVLAGCGHKDDGSTAVPDQGQVMFVHAAWPQASNTIQLSIDDGAATGISYGQSTGYLSLTAGSHAIKLNGATAASGSPITVSKDTYYSCFILPTPTTGTPAVSLIQDDLTLPATGQSRFRLVNQLSGATNVTLAKAVSSTAGTTTYVPIADDSGSFIDFTPSVMALVLLDNQGQVLAQVGTGSRKYETGHLYTAVAVGQLGAANAAYQPKVFVLTNK